MAFASKQDQIWWLAPQQPGKDLAAPQRQVGSGQPQSPVSRPRGTLMDWAAWPVLCRLWPL